jgi:hypothetical protein
VRAYLLAILFFCLTETVLAMPMRRYSAPRGYHEAPAPLRTQLSLGQGYYFG